MLQRTDLSIEDSNYNKVPVTITDSLNAVLTSPDVTQAFLKAVAAIVIRYVGGFVSSIVVEIGTVRKSIEVEKQRQKVTIRIAKLEVITDECAKAVRKAETSNYPIEMKQELIDRLYGLFFEEMATVAPRWT